MSISEDWYQKVNKIFLQYNNQNTNDKNFFSRSVGIISEGIILSTSIG